MRAIWNGTVLAESDETVIVEGRHYFPPDSVHWEHLQQSDKSTSCPWKGRASYHTVVAGEKTNRDAASYYPRPSAAAKRIAGHVAFWHRPGGSSRGKALTTRGVPSLMMHATWNGAVIAESARTVVVEGNHYFPPDDVHFDLLRPRQVRSLCFWKGIARYYDVIIDGQVDRAAAWSYAHPSPLARKIRGHVAFWGGVRVEEVQTVPGADGIGLLDLQASSASSAAATPCKSSADTSGASKIAG